MIANAVYGTFHNVKSGPALVLWTLAESIVLFAEPASEPQTIAQAYSPPPADPPAPTEM